jgi:hypothetical protein
LRWNKNGVDEIAPSLYAGRSTNNRRKAAEAKASDAHPAEHSEQTGGPGVAAVTTPD